MNDLSEFDLDLAECLQNCPELDGPLLDESALNDLCLSDELWANFDLSGFTPSTGVTDQLPKSQVCDDILGLATPPQSPDNAPPLSTTATATHHLPQQQDVPPNAGNPCSNSSAVASSECNILSSSPPVTTRALHVLKSGEVVCVQIPAVNMNGSLSDSAAALSNNSQCSRQSTSPSPTTAIKQEVATVGKRSSHPALDTNDVPSAKLSKKQQRMIKNRESACISRQKKKEYVQCLEKKLQEAAVKNSALLRENTSLRSQISQLEKENGTLKSSYHLSFSTLQKPAVVLVVVLCFAVFMFPKSMFNLPFVNHHNPNTALTAVTTVKGRALLSYPLEEEQQQQQEETETHALVPISNALSNFMKQMGRKKHRNSEEKQRAPFIASKVCSCPPQNDSRLNHTAMKSLSYKLSECFKAGEEGFPPMYYTAQDTRNKNSLALVHPTDSMMDMHFKKHFRRDLDSFYIVSFKDHLLLDAPSHNISSRPRISVLVPNSRSAPSSGYNVMSMLQINCEVLGAEVVNMDTSKVA